MEQYQRMFNQSTSDGFGCYGFNFNEPVANLVPMTCSQTTEYRPYRDSNFTLPIISACDSLRQNAHGQL
nr:hypothetical transcript [Hymenolepis microstoma]